MFVLLCLVNTVKDIVVIKENLPATTGSKIKTTPNPTLNNISTPTPLPEVITVPDDWYIWEQRDFLDNSFTNVLILGFDNKFNSIKLNISTGSEKWQYTYSPILFKWSSSNPQIATVNNGIVTAVSTGAVTVSVEKDNQIKKYDINVYSSDNVDLITEANYSPIKSEIYINSQIYIYSYFLIKDINLKIMIPRLTKWSSSNTDIIKIYNQYEDVLAVPFKTGKATISAEILGKVTKFNVNIEKPSTANIKYINDKTYYMKIYDSNPKDDIQYWGTSNIFPFEVLLTDSKGKIIDVAEYIDWKSTSTYVTANLDLDFMINAEKLGKAVLTGKYFDYDLTFNVDVSRGVVSKPDLLNSTTPPNFDYPVHKRPTFLIEKDNPTTMSEINKKIIYTLKENINNPAIINDANKDIIRIDTITTGYFTQQQDRESVVIIHLVADSGLDKIYYEVVGIFDFDTFKYKSHKVFTAKAPNSIVVKESSVIFIPMDPAQDFMANTIEVWIIKDGYWKINSKPKDTQYHRYINNGIIKVFDKTNKLDYEWEFKYNLALDSENNLIYAKETYDWEENRVNIAQAITSDNTQEENPQYEYGTKSSGLHSICNYLLYKMDESTSIYKDLRSADPTISRILENVYFNSIEYGYFTQNEKLEILALFSINGLNRVMICDAETYEVKIQKNIDGTFSTLEDQTGKSMFFVSKGHGEHGESHLTISLLAANKNSIDTVWVPNKINDFSIENSYILIGDKLIILRRVSLPRINEISEPWEYMSEYKWDTLQHCFIKS